MKLTIMIVSLVGLLAAPGCKKEPKSAPAVGSGSAALGSGAATGSGAKMDPMPDTMGGMAGSNTMAGSGTMAGSDKPATGSDSGSMMRPPDPPPDTGAGASMTDADIEAMIKEMLGMFTDISKAAVAGKDCAGSAAGINKVLDAHKPFTDKLKTLSKDKALEDRAQKIMEDKGYTKQLDKVSEGLAPVMQKCATDDAMGKAMQRLGEALQ